MLYKDFVKTPTPLYSIIFMNIMMCFFGFSVSFTRTNIEWARITLSTLWITMLVASTLNQGMLYHNVFTRWFDHLNAFALQVLYIILYWKTMEWWHIGSGIVAVTSFLGFQIFFLEKATLSQYINIVNLWHIWVMIQIFLIPYSLAEGPLFEAS